MLDTMRRHSESFFVYLIFGAIIVVFAVNFGPGSGSCSPAGNNYAAVVNGDSISAQSFQLSYNRQIDRYRRQMRGSGGEFSAEMAEKMGLKKQVIDGLIDKKVLAHVAAQRGLSVSDDELLDYLKAQFGIEDVTYDQYESFVQRNFETSVSKFETEIREEIAGQKLMQIVTDGLAVSDAELKEDFQREHDRAMLSYVKFEMANKGTKPSEAEIDKVLSADLTAVQARYDRDVAKYSTPHEVRARQIVKKLAPDASDADVAKVRGVLLDLKAQIEGGADFASLAKEQSDDEATKKDGGDMGFFSKGQRIKALEDAVFALKKDKPTAEPVRTPMGLHLLQWVDERLPAQKNFDEVKREVAAALLKDQADEQTAQQEADKFLGQLKSGKKWLDLTQTHEERTKQKDDKKLLSQDTPWILRSQSFVSGIGPAPELQSAAFALGKAGDLVPQAHKVGRSFYVVMLKEREIPDMSKFEAEAKSLRNEALWSKRSRVFRDWMNHLRKQADVKLNPALFPAETVAQKQS